MQEPDYWSQCAEAMELSLEGRRLIAEEVTALAREKWQDATRKLAGVVHRWHDRPHLPPI